MLKRLPRIDPVCAALALAGALGLWLLSGTDPYWSDWGRQDGRWVAKLLGGDVQGFINGAHPTYLASLILRSPLFLAAGALGGAEDEAFYAAKAFALLLLAGFGGWLMGRARAKGAGIGVLVMIAFVTAGSPIAGRALDNGHAEDLVAACLAVAGVLAAGRGRLTLAGVLVGLGFVSKQWAILAWLPAMAVAPRRPWQVLAVAAPVAGVFLVPLLFRTGGVAGGLQSDAFEIWRSHQLFWPLGVDNPDPEALRPKLPPEWFVPIPRLLIVGMSLPLSALWWRHRRRGGGQPHDVLLLLALLFFFRCLFEPWNIDYYHLPFLLTLAAWEVLSGRGKPILALLATGATWISFNTWTQIEVYGHATYAIYMGWTLPLAFVLLRELLFDGLRMPFAAGRRSGNAQGVQPASR
jgi:hypothetical protein